MQSEENNNNKKILITGAGGFIGSFMVEKALDKGFKTWAGVRKTTSRDYLTNPEINFIDLPFNNPEKLEKELLAFKEKNGRWDTIIYNLGVTKCKDKKDFEKINFGYNKNFVDALIKCDMVPDQYISMSSLSVYGPGDEINMTPITLNDEKKPNTAYGESKLMAENYLKSLPDFPYVIIRPTGVYGPREKDYFLMVKSICAGFDFGAGYKPQQITFIYVKDLIECIFRVIEKGFIRKEYNVSEERAYTSSEFRLYAQKKLGKKVVVPVTVPLFVLKAVSFISEKIGNMQGKASTLNMDKYRIMKQRNWKCDISEIQKDLDFTPEYSLEKGVSEIIEWYKKEGWI